MKKTVLALLCILIVALSAQASLFGSGDDEEITPLQYSALLGLRDLDSDLFRTKLLPLIEEAMKDGKITVRECRTIERAAGNVAEAFYRAARAPRWKDSFSETLDKAKRGGEKLGDKLEDTLGNQLPQLLDETMELFRDELRAYEEEQDRERADEQAGEATRL